MQYAGYGLAIAAILVMGLNVVQSIRLKRAIIGGEIGEKWGVLTLLVAVFFVCYLFSPLALYYEIPNQYLNMLVFGVFLFGAVFVWVVVGIIRDMLTFLKLVK
jgi:hypothetical protein